MSAIASVVLGVVLACVAFAPGVTLPLLGVLALVGAVVFSWVALVEVLR